jgi:Ala-tRNA(Pro) deacylase
MSIAISLQKYLNGRGVPYDVVPHARTMTSSKTARAAGIPEDDLAKGVLVKYANGYILAILPASRHVSLEEIEALFERRVSLATEDELRDVFRDCEVGAIPPLANAYGLEAVMDESLEAAKDVYFEGGDHRSLVHLKGRDFTELMAEVPHAHISTAHH